MIKTIIFDIGGVITFTNFKNIYDQFAERAGLPLDFVTNYHKDHINEMLFGTIGLQKFFADMADGADKSESELQKIWLEVGLAESRINPELVDLIKELRKNYSLGILTNVSPHRQIIDEAMGLYSLFDYKIQSCNVGLKKPDPRFYDLAIKAANVNPDEAIFIDDNKDFIDAATKIGIKAILYTNNESLKHELKGVLI